MIEMTLPPVMRSGAAALCCVCALLVRAHIASCAEPTPAPSPTPLVEIGRVVTSDRQDEPLRSTVRTTYVVTKAEMIARGYASVADALTDVPGVVVERYGALGSTANIGIRGSSSAQVLVLLDGRPLAGAQTGTVDLGAVSTTSIERVEVVEGGGATLYGAGAIGGVINILTTHPQRATFVRIEEGTLGTHAVTFEAPHVAFERRVATNDYSYIGTTVPSGTRLNADAESTTARIRGSHRVGAFDVDASVGFADAHLGVPGPIALPFSSPPPNPSLASSYQSATTRQHTLNEDARISLTHASPRSTATVDVGATRQTLLFYSAPGDPLGCFTAQGTQPCADLDTETRVSVNLRDVVETEHSRAVYGVDLARGVARIDAGGGIAPTNAFAQTAAYAQETVDGTHGRAYAGVRAERDGGQGGVVAPSLGGMLTLTPAVALRLNYAVGFRAPSAVDLYYPGFSNAALHPERTQSIDATLRDSRIAGGISLTYFTLSGSDLIVVNPRYDYGLPPGPGNEPLVNAQHASIAGVTLDVQTVPYHGLTAVLGVMDLYRALDLTTVATRLAGRPVFTASLGLEYAAPRSDRGLVGAGIVARDMGARSSAPLGGAIDPTQYATPFTAVDAFLRWRLGRDVVISLRGFNIGNERYAAIASPPFGGYPAPGRTFVIEAGTR